MPQLYICLPKRTLTNQGVTYRPENKKYKIARIKCYQQKQKSLSENLWITGGHLNTKKILQFSAAEQNKLGDITEKSIVILFPVALNAESSNRSGLQAAIKVDFL